MKIFFLTYLSVTLTDGMSVTLDINGKPFLRSKGIVSQNAGSVWKILCDDNGDFHSNGLNIANDICNIIGFKLFLTLFVHWAWLMAISSYFQVSKGCKSRGSHRF